MSEAEKDLSKIKPALRLALTDEEWRAFNEFLESLPLPKASKIEAAE